MNNQNSYNMAKKVKKKFLTGGKIKGHMQSPNQVLAQNQLNWDKADKEAATNPWHVALDVAGPMIGQLAGMGSQYVNRGSQSFPIDPNGGATITRTEEAIDPNYNLDYMSNGNIFESIYDINSYGGYNGRTVTAATGGLFGAEVEAEGEEVVETPDGMTAELKGPSHENGGIDLTLPSGTKIYSKRIKGADGKSMAVRKKNRDRTLENLTKKLSKDPKNATLRKTVEQYTKASQMQDEQDLMIMEQARQEEEMKKNPKLKTKMATGGKLGDGGRLSKFDFLHVPAPARRVGWQPNFLNGTTQTHLYGSTDYEDISAAYPALAQNPFTNEFFTPLDAAQHSKEMGTDFIGSPLQARSYASGEWKGFYDSEGNPADTDISKINQFFKKSRDPFKKRSSFYKPIPEEDEIVEFEDEIPLDVAIVSNRKSTSPDVPNPNSLNVPLVSETKETYLGQNSNPVESPKKGLPLNLGDLGTALGMAGTGISTFAPYFNTMKNRAGDQVHENMFENYGEEGLAKFREVYGINQATLEQALVNNQRNTDTAMENNRLGARGLNTSRALDLAMIQQKQQADSAANMQYYQNEAQLKTQEASMIDAIDGQRIQGEAMARQLNDADRDAYYNARGLALANMGTGIQQFGKHLGTMHNNEVTNNILGSLYRNYRYDARRGTIEGVPESTVVDTVNSLSLKGASNEEIQTIIDKVFKTKEYTIDPRTGNIYNKEGKTIFELNK